MRLEGRLALLLVGVAGLTIAREFRLGNSLAGRRRIGRGHRNRQSGSGNESSRDGGQDHSFQHHISPYGFQRRPVSRLEPKPQ